MEFIFLYFAIAWVLAAVVSTAIWRSSKHWPRVLRVLLASYVAALFAAPSIVVGHGIAPVPLLLQLISQPENFGRGVAIAFGVTWLLTLLIFFVISALTKPE